MPANGPLPGHPAGRRTGLSEAVTTVFSVLVAVVILGPMLLPGFPLRYDLVSVPQPVLGHDALGLGDRLPRAVPLDAVTAVLAKVLPDAWLTQLLAVLALVLAGTGAAKLAAVPLPGRLVAVLAAQWNPFVLEQLSIGHVPHLLAYGAAPWVGWAGWCLTSGRPASRPWAVLVLAAAVGSLTPGGGLLIVLAALAGLVTGCWQDSTDHAEADHADQVDGARPRLRLLAGFAPVLLLQLPWLVAGAMAPGSGGADSQSTGVFALRGETGWGRLVDALGLAGMWNATALPASRGTVLAQLSTLLVTGLALGGLLHLRSAVRQHPGRNTGVLASGAACLICYLVAVLPILPGGRGVLSAVIRAVPGAGLLRDGHRWLALPAMAFAVLAAHAVTGAAALVAERSGGSAGSGGTGPLWRWAAAGLTAGLLVAALPDLGMGLSGRLRAWHYPPEWAAARSVLDRSPDSARVLILPWQPFREFAWSGGRSAVLDPAPRLLPRQTIVSDALPVSGSALPAEGPGSQQMAADLADGVLTGDELRSLAIGWLLVERGTPGALPALPAGWSLVEAGPSLQLWRAPGRLPRAPQASTVRAVAVIGSHVLSGSCALLALLVLSGCGANRAMRRSSRGITIGDRRAAPARH